MPDPVRLFGRSEVGSAVEADTRSNSGILAEPALEPALIEGAGDVPGVARIALDFESPPIDYLYS